MKEVILNDGWHPLKYRDYTVLIEEGKPVKVSDEGDPLAPVNGAKHAISAELQKLFRRTYGLGKWSKTSEGAENIAVLIG